MASSMLFFQLCIILILGEAISFCSFVIWQVGSKPIEIAAESGRRKLVEVLFPFTSPIQAVSNWSVEGIIAHAKSINPKEVASI